VVDISVEQWSRRVLRGRGEEVRKWLIHKGFLDSKLKIRSEGDFVIFPVLNEREGKARDIFETRRMHESLPRHELIGGIAIIQDRDIDGAERILASRPSIHTVLYALSGVEGTYRIKRFEVLAGTSTTRTRFTEYGYKYNVDLSVAYFSARLSDERQHILRIMKENEWVLDMFSGVGPFAITLSKKAALILASDINPRAISLMIENIHVNRSKNVIPMLTDASSLKDVIQWKFDRVIMNNPLSSVKFIKHAFDLCKEGGHIHFYVLQSVKGEFIPIINRYPAATIIERTIRSYSPTQWHAVYDIEVE